MPETDPTEFNQGLLDFIQASPTPFHAVRAMTQRLDAAGFTRLRESEHWQPASGGRHYVVRNDSSLIALRLSTGSIGEQGVNMVGAHTDSPCLKLKPQPESTKKSYAQLGVEVYGGALLNPWFDRDLSLAGRVSYLAGGRAIKSALIDFRRPVAVIPSLAIHLDRDVNQNRSVNAQTDLPPLVMQVGDEQALPLRDLLLAQLRSEQPDCDAERILDFELSLYDTQAPALVGMHGEFIAGARLDNLLSCYAGLRALIEAGGTGNALLVCNDHEEVGSNSAAGAQGPFLRSVLERLAESAPQLSRAIDRSLFISADNAHGVHPNFPDKHDGNHGPLLNHGPVIKFNASQRYASNSETSALFRHLCERAGVPVQTFVMRADMACGSTIGPITATELGVRTLDVGVPQLAMHSIRELAGSRDVAWLAQVLRLYYDEADLLKAGA